MENVKGFTTTGLRITRHPKLKIKNTEAIKIPFLKNFDCGFYMLWFKKYKYTQLSKTHSISPEGITLIPSIFFGLWYSVKYSLSLNKKFQISKLFQFCRWCIHMYVFMTDVIFSVVFTSHAFHLPKNKSSSTNFNESAFCDCTLLLLVVN